MFTTISENYTHLVEYCETDAMRIVHHSEYIKWMEYSRHQYFLAHGFDWAEMEKELGIMMPILSVGVTYKNMTRFGDKIKVIPKLEKFNGIYIDFSYKIVDCETGELKAIGKTRSGFIDSNYDPVMLQDAALEYYNLIERK